MMPSDSRNSLSHIPMKCLEGTIGCSLSGHAHELDPGGKFLSAYPERLPEPPAGPVTMNRAAHLAAHRKPDLQRSVPIPPEHEQRRPLHAFPPLEYGLELFTPPKPFAPGNPASSRPYRHGDLARQ